jgi:hypothetical protein
MSSGSAPCSAWIMTFENVEKIIPNEWNQFESILYESKNDIEDFCRVHEFFNGDFNELIDSDNFDFNKIDVKKYIIKINDCWKLVFDSFEEKTGLEIFPNYHDSDSGDIYDDEEVNGGFFTVSGARQFTDAGEKYKESLMYVRWTQFG